MVPQQSTERSSTDEDIPPKSSSMIVQIGSAYSAQMLWREATPDVKDTDPVQPTSQSPQQQALTTTRSSSSAPESVASLTVGSSIDQLSPETGTSAKTADFDAKLPVSSKSEATKSTSNDDDAKVVAKGASPSATESVPATSKPVDLQHPTAADFDAKLPVSSESQAKKLESSDDDAKVVAKGVSPSATEPVPATSKPVDLQHPTAVPEHDRQSDAVATTNDNDLDKPPSAAGLESSKVPHQKLAAAGSPISITLSDFDRRGSTAVSSKALDADRSEPRQLTDDQPHLPEELSTAAASPASSYATVMSTGDTDKPDHMTEPAGTTYQPVPTPQIPASKTDETTEEPHELKSSPLSEVSAPQATEAAKHQDTKQVGFATNDEDKKEEPPIDRRPTPFAQVSPRDSSPEAGPDDVDETKVVNSERSSSPPDLVHHPQTSRGDVASRSSLPTAPPMPACDTATVSPEVEDASSPDGGSVQRKSVHISRHVSTLVPCLPDHVTDDTEDDKEEPPTDRRQTPFAQVSPRGSSPEAGHASTVATTTSTAPPTPAVETVPVVPISDEVPPPRFDVPKGNDKENVYPDLLPDVPKGDDQENKHPDVSPESLDEPLPLAKSNKVDNELQKLEDESAALSVNVDPISEKMSTVEPQMSMPEIVYTILHEEKQAKDIDSDADTEDVETKTPLTKYKKPVTESGIMLTLSDFDDDNLAKKDGSPSVHQREESPPKAKKVTLSDFDMDADNTDGDNVAQKVGISSVDQTEESPSKAEDTQVAPPSLGTEKRSKTSEMGKLTPVSSKIAAFDDLHQWSTIAVGRPSNAD